MSTDIFEDLVAEDCLEYQDGDNGCEGEVGYHSTGGSDYRSWPRCTKHQEARMERRENSIEKYADSDIPPSWFDPADAGEHWGDDY